jgi:hypothetical protein
MPVTFGPKTDLETLRKDAGRGLAAKRRPGEAADLIGEAGGRA